MTRVCMSFNKITSIIFAQVPEGLFGEMPNSFYAIVSAVLKHFRHDILPVGIWSQMQSSVRINMLLITHSCFSSCLQTSRARLTRVRLNYQDSEEHLLLRTFQTTTTATLIVSGEYCLQNRLEFVQSDLSFFSSAY